ncbi:hypothetical protein BDN71DRAFT_104750 [Pleurotus eryngii]|uniref:Uncharacterized protein n=1 Tax=Pleurotus eryngii TaxID=5323 RepID=A0A9P5ZP83_PLEER|nr:hypothetical protein BDN71DRAFT_104750 [Pleurotus eryngii]
MQGGDLDILRALALVCHDLLPICCSLIHAAITIDEWGRPGVMPKESLRIYSGCPHLSQYVTDISFKLAWPKPTDTSSPSEVSLIPRLVVSSALPRLYIGLHKLEIGNVPSFDMLAIEAPSFRSLSVPYTIGNPIPRKCPFDITKLTLKHSPNPSWTGDIAFEPRQLIRLETLALQAQNWGIANYTARRCSSSCCNN